MNMYVEFGGNKGNVISRDLRSMGNRPERFDVPLPGAGRPALTTPDIQMIIREVEQISLAFNKRLQFHVNHQSNEVTVKVIDAETDKVIRELPPEELQRIRNRVQETVGVLFDEQV